MPHMMVSTGRALIPTGNYDDKVMATGPLAYWPLSEASGTVAHCLTNAAMNGTYSSDVSTWPVGAGIGDGNTAPQADGVNDYINVYTAAFDAAFNGAEGTLATWLRVANLGVWTDGARRDANLFLTNFGDYVAVRKNAVNNQFDWLYAAGGVTETVVNAAMTTTDWFHVAITWSAAADEVRAYLNGTQEGATQTVLGVWAGGGFQVTLTCLAASNTTPANPWQGGIGRFAVWTRPLPLAEITELAQR